MATAAEPIAAQKYSSSMVSDVLAKREPTKAPSTTTAELPSHHGNVTCTKSPPCSSADAAIAPNKSPPGNRSQCTTTALMVDAVTSTASSPNEELAPAGVGGRPLAAKPNKASPLGRPIVTTSTRTVWTIAIPRKLAPNSVERHLLRHRAGGRSAKRRRRLPAMHQAQIGGGRADHHRSRRRQHHDAQRPARHAAQRRWRHNRSQQDADQHKAYAREWQRHLRGPAHEGGCCGDQHRARHQAGGNAQ